MGLMDKVKAQASQAASKAQEGLKAGQAKLDEAQASKRADALLRDLGAQVFAERTGRADASTGAEIERLVTELREHEARTRPIDTSPTADDATAADAPAASEPAADAPGAEAPAQPPAANYNLDDI